MFHQSFYSQSQQRPSFHNNHVPNHFFMPAHSSFNPRASRINQSSQHLKISRDFEHFTMPSHGFPSMSQGYPFYDLNRWRQYMAKFQQQYRRTPAFHFQDKSTFYYMSDPIMTKDNRITIQLTKVHIGLNGDQQRVFVEQDFSNENEYKNFVKNLKFNFEKTFENQNTTDKKPGVVVIEEPDEEPKIYEQQTYNEQYPRLPLISSCSTICSNKPRKNKMKYHRQNVKSPSYAHHYEPPPRFQKENHFHIPPNQNSFWKFNGNQNRSRFTRLKDQQKSQGFSQFRRTQQQQQQPRTVADNLIFTNNKQQHIRVDRTKSECRSKTPLFRNRNKIPQFFNHRQRNHFTPLVFPSTPILFRNTQIQFRLFHFYHPNSNHF